ncbi:MAG: FISUMP domain-containing protein [Chitinophagales bacterium]
MKRYNFILLIINLFLISPFVSAQTQIQLDVEPDSIFYFKDERDKKSYKAITFGNVSWMAEPLRYKTSDSWCYKIKNACKTYGRMYIWEDAIQACPPGWKLPDTSNWASLINIFGGEKIAGAGIAFYDSLTFQINYAFPPNIYGRFADSANEMHFWSATSVGENTAWHYYVVKDKLPYIAKSYISKNYNLSCLCVKEEITSTSSTD